jgi:hypothetical protein
VSQGRPAEVAFALNGLIETLARAADDYTSLRRTLSAVSIDRAVEEPAADVELVRAIQAAVERIRQSEEALKHVVETLGGT